MVVKKIEGEIMTARPEGMEYEMYRAARKEQNKRLKERLKCGFLVWPRKKGTLVGKVPVVEFVK